MVHVNLKYYLKSYRKLTVDEFLNYMAYSHLSPVKNDEEIQTCIDTVLDEVAMRDKRAFSIGSLNHGQRKRLNIALELLTDPKLVFLDNPILGFTQDIGRRVFFILKQLTNLGRTIIIVTDDTSNLAECDLVAFLVDGQLAFYGPPKDSLSFFKVEDFVEINSKINRQTNFSWHKSFSESVYYNSYIQQRLLNVE